MEFLINASRDIDASGLASLITDFSTQFRIIIGVLLGVIGLAAVATTIFYLVKAGFNHDEQKRKQTMTALFWLWGSVVVMAIAWGASEGIIAWVSNSFSS